MWSKEDLSDLPELESEANVSSTTSEETTRSQDSPAVVPSGPGVPRPFPPEPNWIASSQDPPAVLPSGLPRPFPTDPNSIAPSQDAPAVVPSALPRPFPIELKRIVYAPHSQDAPAVGPSALPRPPFPNEPNYVCTSRRIVFRDEGPGSSRSPLPRFELGENTLNPGQIGSSEAASIQSKLRKVAVFRGYEAREPWRPFSYDTGPGTEYIPPRSYAPLTSNTPRNPSNPALTEFPEAGPSTSQGSQSSSSHISRRRTRWNPLDTEPETEYIPPRSSPEMASDSNLNYPNPTQTESPEAGPSTARGSPSSSSHISRRRTRWNPLDKVLAEQMNAEDDANNN